MTPSPTPVPTNSGVATLPSTAATIIVAALSIQSRFDTAWLAGQHQEIQDLMAISNQNDRWDAAMTLHLNHPEVLIDLAIVMYFWSPYFVMIDRTNAGCPYVGTLKGIGVDPMGINPSDQAPLWVFPPWDRSTFPAHVIPTVWVNAADDVATLADLAKLYPPPPPPPVPIPPTPTFNPIGFNWNIQRDYEAPDGTLYKNCRVFNYNGPSTAGVDGDLYTAPNGAKYILGVTMSIWNTQSRLWYQISGPMPVVNAVLTGGTHTSIAPIAPVSSK